MQYKDLLMLSTEIAKDNPTPNKAEIAACQPATSKHQRPARGNRQPTTYPGENHTKMTVQQLIEWLQTLSPDSAICITDIGDQQKFLIIAIEPGASKGTVSIEIQKN